MSSLYASFSGRQQGRNSGERREPSLPPEKTYENLPLGGRRYRSLSISAQLQEADTHAGPSAAVSCSLPRNSDGSFAVVDPQDYFVDCERCYQIPIQPDSHSEPTNHTESPISPHSQRSASNHQASSVTMFHELRAPSSHGDKLVATSSRYRGSPCARRGLLRNRDYYPSRYHQEQFDAMAAHDPKFLEQRESVGLNTLDGDLEQQPLYSMPLIIECAILGSPQQKLTLAELRITLKQRFHYYGKEEEKGVRSWERTLLQNLSKKERFQNIERPDPGQGGYWSINHNAPPANRSRKRVKRIDPFLDRILERYVSSNDPGPTNYTLNPNALPHTMSSQSPTPIFSKIGGPESLFPTLLSEGRNYISLPMPSDRRNQRFPTSPRHYNGSFVLLD